MTRQKRVCFVAPAKTCPISGDGELAQKPRADMSLPAATILGALEEDGYECHFIDVAAEGWNDQSMVGGHLLRYGLSDSAVVSRIDKLDASIVLITSMFTFEQMLVDPLVRCIKQRLPNTIVVVGGIHATAKPEWHFEEAAPDFVVLGEGEETIVDLLGELCSDAGDPARVPGIVFRDCGGGLHRTQPRMPAESLRTGWCYNTVLRMPDGQPRYSDRLARKSPIYSSEVAGEEAGVFSLYGTRGCAGSCNYCTATRRDGKLIRHLGDDALFRQFRLVRRQFHVAVFCNQADAFGVHPADSSFLKMVADYRRVTGDVGFVLNNPNAFRLQRLFSQNARPEVDDSFLDLLQDSGFNVITLAIETVNQRFNSKIDWAKIRYEQVTELCQAIRAKGMKSDVYMMYGFPDETAEEFNADLAFAEGLRRWVDQVTWHSLSLLPGTAYYDEYVVRTGREDAYRRIIRDGYGCHMPRREFNVSRVPTERFEAALASFGKGWS